MKPLSHEYRLIANQIAGLGMQIPVTLEVPKVVEQSIGLLCVQFDQLRVRDQDLEPSLPFSGLKDGKIVNVEAFTESADVYVELHDSNICEALNASFAEEKKLLRTFKNQFDYAKGISALVAHRAELVESYEALGFKTIDRAMTVQSEFSMQRVSGLIKADKDLEVSVDVKQVEDGFKIFYPHHIEKSVFDLIETYENDFFIHHIEAFPKSVPGYKDVEDYTHRLQVKAGLEEKTYARNDFGLS